jgi:hypothetical protein
MGEKSAFEDIHRETERERETHTQRGRERESKVSDYLEEIGRR